MNSFNFASLIGILSLPLVACPGGVSVIGQSPWANDQIGQSVPFVKGGVDTFQEFRQIGPLRERELAHPSRRKNIRGRMSRTRCGLRRLYEARHLGAKWKGPGK